MADETKTDKQNAVETNAETTSETVIVEGDFCSSVPGPLHSQREEAVCIRPGPVRRLDGNCGNTMRQAKSRVRRRTDVCSWKNVQNTIEGRLEY